jgi:hypothetical protein
MSANVNRFWWRWLIVVNVGVILFALSFILLPNTLQSLFNLPFYGTTDSTTLYNERAHDYISFIYTILGAVMVGWMITILFTLYGPFRHGEGLGWTTIALSITVWYVLDTASSLLLGFGFNAILNTVFFLLFFIPLAATYRDFYRHTV